MPGPRGGLLSTVLLRQPPAASAPLATPAGARGGKPSSKATKAAASLDTATDDQLRALVTRLCDDGTTTQAALAEAMGYLSRSGLNDWMRSAKPTLAPGKRAALVAELRRLTAGE